MDVLPRVKAVSPGRVPLTLNVEWNDGTKSKVDMTGLVYSSRHFRVFAEDAAAFRQVKPDEFCTGIEWANGLDYSARTLKMLADEQKPMLWGSFIRSGNPCPGASSTCFSVTSI